MNETEKSAVRMANQIARNFGAIGHDAAITATADHIESFWDPRMKAAASALLAKADSGLSENAATALRRLQKTTRSAVRSREQASGGTDAC